MPVPLLQIGAGLLQTGIGAVESGIATNQLEKLKSPTYTQNKGIVDFYNQALQRFGVSPTASALYKRQNRDIDRGVATGIAALNDRRSGIAGASSILRAANDARLDANVAAEQEQSRRFGQLGTAAQMKAGEDRLAFEINENQPFERKYNLLSQKAGAKAQLMNSGIQNIFGGFQAQNNIDLLNELYGEGGRSTTSNSSAPKSGLTGFSNEWLYKNRKRKY